MSMRTKKILAAVALVALALPLLAGMASAATTVDDLGQGASAVGATVENLVVSFMDVLDGHQPEGADGVESEIPDVDPRYVEGPLGGLIVNGPLE